MWQTEYNGVVAFFRLDLVTTLSGFQFFLIFFLFSPPISRFVTFSFLFAKKDKKNQLSLETKDSQPSSKIFKLEHHSNVASVTFFAITQSKLTPSF